MKNTHIAIVATVAGLAVAPSAAHAQEAEMLALSAQVTVVVDGASYGYTGGRLTPATVRQVRMAMRGIIQGALASGLTWQQIQFAVSRGIAQSSAGAVAIEMAQVVGVAAYDAWVFLLRSVKLPAMPLWIMLENPGYIDMATIWAPYPDDYVPHDGYDTETGGDSETASSGGSGGSGGSGDDTAPGNDRPKTKFDSAEHQNGYWVAAGCFPPMPDVHHVSAADMMVSCTGNESPAPMMMVPVMGSCGAVIGSEWVSTIPLGIDSQALLLLPMEGADTVPTVVHWF